MKEKNTTAKTKNTNSARNREMDVEVLYQKLGDRWFAFSLVNGEMFMAPISEDVIEEIRGTTGTNRNPGSSPDETV